MSLRPKRLRLAAPLDQLEETGAADDPHGCLKRGAVWGGGLYLIQTVFVCIERPRGDGDVWLTGSIQVHAKDAHGIAHHKPRLAVDHHAGSCWFLKTTRGITLGSCFPDVPNVTAPLGGDGYLRCVRKPSRCSRA